MLGVQSRIQHYTRVLDVLACAGETLRGLPAHNVSDYACGGDPLVAPAGQLSSPRYIGKLTQEEFFDIMTSPADAYLRPPPCILDEVAQLRLETVAPEDGVEEDPSMAGDRLPEVFFPPGPLFNGADLTRSVGDGSMASGSSGYKVGGQCPDSGGSCDRSVGAASGNAGGYASTSGGTGAPSASGKVDVGVSSSCVLSTETYKAPAPHTPSEEALQYLEELLAANSSPARTMRAALKAAVLFISPRAGTVPHKIMSCLGWWWLYVHMRAEEQHAASPGKQWQLGVNMPTRLLRNKRRTRLASSVGFTLHVLERIPSNDSDSSQNETAASIVLLWDRVPEVRQTLTHARCATVSASTRRKAISAAAPDVGRVRSVKKGRTSARAKPSRPSTPAGSSAPVALAPRLAPSFAAAAAPVPVGASAASTDGVSAAGRLTAPVPTASTSGVAAVAAVATRALTAALAAPASG